MNMEDLPIEKLFHEKLMLYRELAEILREEKKWIIHAGVDALWRVCAKKNATVAEIEKVRAKIIEKLDRAGIRHTMTLQNFQASGIIALLPLNQRKRLSEVHPALAQVKEEIKTIGKDNRRYIESSLHMLDDLMCILMGTDHQPAAYHPPSRKVAMSGGARLLHREV
jgi:hypothetical protein